jgi:hypothetical protein
MERKADERAQELRSSIVRRWSNLPGGQEDKLKQLTWNGKIDLICNIYEYIGIMEETGLSDDLRIMSGNTRSSQILVQMIRMAREFGEEQEDRAMDGILRQFSSSLLQQR